MSKTISMVAIVGTLVVIGGIIINGSSKTVEYVAQEPEVVTQVVTEQVDNLQAAVDAAIAASSTEIEAEAQEAYNATKKRLEQEIEVRVKTEHKARLEGEIDALNSEISSY